MIPSPESQDFVIILFGTEKLYDQGGAALGHYFNPTALKKRKWNFILSRGGF